MEAGHRRNGYASEAVVMLLRFMFGERRFHKCGARVFADNEVSLAFQRRLGFVEEGRLRDQVFSAGEHHDVVMMGLLADEFAQLHATSGWAFPHNADATCWRSSNGHCVRGLFRLSPEPALS